MHGQHRVQKLKQVLDICSGKQAKQRRKMTSICAAGLQGRPHPPDRRGTEPRRLQEQQRQIAHVRASSSSAPPQPPLLQPRPALRGALSEAAAASATTRASAAAEVGPGRGVLQPQSLIVVLVVRAVVFQLVETETEAEWAAGSSGEAQLQRRPPGKKPISLSIFLFQPLISEHFLQV